MNKSIYEKAQKYATHLNDYISDRVPFTPHTIGEREYIGDALDAIDMALEQAQKQEKLLNRIKDIINKDYDSYIVSMLEEPKRYDEIVKQIEELEK